MWTVGDICKEIQDVSKLIEGKDTIDSFCHALVKGACAKIKGLADLPPGDAVRIKDAARCLNDAHLKSIVDVLGQRMTLGVVDISKSLVLKPQTLLHIYNYMTHDEWKELDNPNTSWARKQTVVALRLKMLGIASMHEQTMKACMALLACSLTVVPEEKMMYDMLQEFKATFASTTCTTKCSTISKYPEHPKELCQDVYQAAYASGQPCPRVIDQFNLVAKKVVLRNTSKHIRNTPAKVEQHQSASAGSTPSMNEMMNTPMMHMFNMMCSRLMGIGNHGEGPGQHQYDQGQGSQAPLHNFKPKTQLALGDAPGEAPNHNTDSKLVLPCNTPAPPDATEEPAATPSTQKGKSKDSIGTKKGQSNDSLDTQAEEPDYETAAFNALKHREASAKAKAKAKAKTKANAKGKAKASPKPAIMKRPSSSNVSASKKAKILEYKVPPPSEAQLKSTPRNYYDKHYHKCKQMAIKTGHSEEDACELAKKARATAVELWDSNCS